MDFYYILKACFVIVLGTVCGGFIGFWIGLMAATAFAYCVDWFCTHVIYIYGGVLIGGVIGFLLSTILVSLKVSGRIISVTFLSLSLLAWVTAITLNPIIFRLFHPQKWRQQQIQIREKRLKDSALAKAAKNNDILQVERLAKSASSQEREDVAGIAISQNSPQQLRILLDAGVSGSAKNLYGHSLLILAIVQGNPEMVDLLLDHGADPNTYTTQHAAIGLATKKQQVEVVRLFLERADRVQHHNILSSLTEAVRSGNVEIVRLFLQAEISYDSRYLAGVLEIAIWEEHLEIVDLLHKHGATLNLPEREQDNLELWERALEGDRHYVVGTLAALNIVNLGRKHKTPLMMAVKAENIELVKVLLDAGVSVAGTPDDCMKAPLLEAVKQGSTEIVELLLQGGASREGECAYWSLWAANQGDRPDWIALFARYNLDLNATGPSGRTFLMDMAYYGRRSFVEVLIESGADIEGMGNNSSRTALMVASFNGQTGAVEALLAGGAQVNRKTSSGQTALHFAAMNRFKKTEPVRKLLEAGADPNAKTNTGETPLSYARKYENSEIITLLEFGAD